MISKIELDEISIEVVKKKIKNLTLRVHPPLGNVRISAPNRMSLDSIRTFVISKLDWIKQQQQRLKQLPQASKHEYINDEHHYLWGKRYSLCIIEKQASPGLRLEDDRIQLQVRPGADKEQRQAVIEAWYRTQLRLMAIPLIDKFEPLMGVKVARLSVREMTSRWGSCTPHTQSIRLNTELAKKPPVFLEYIVVHEMVHLLEPSHNHRFQSFMDQFMPEWRVYRKGLRQGHLR